ncbi:NERD domain-containing protein [Bacillus sp. APMAM]|nr:NERD domain-containing protein [Bacillus sp. APMAM]RTZ56385.1 NERD domain-containing protein [Bacillus sp. SAJ1]
MIVKNRTVPIRVLQDKALLDRLPKNHKKYPTILENYKTFNTGHLGEKNIDYYLEILPEKDYFIFHGLRLEYKSQHFQIDTLILTSNFALILEVKTIKGTLFFDTKFKQMIQILDGKKKGYPYPITQVNRQKELLRKWMEEHNIKSYPMEGLVVISRQSTILDTNAEDNSIYEIVIHASNLLERINDFHQIYKKKIFSTPQMKKMSDLLLNAHTPLYNNILQLYDIDQNELIRGVQCPSCESYPMNYKNRYWYCAKCSCKSNSGFRKAIYEYFLLIEPFISNQDCRKFLLINSPKSSRYFLKSMELKMTRSGRFIKYKMPNNIDEEFLV